MSAALLRHLRPLVARGYRLFRPTGELTASELCMHARVVGIIPRFGVISRVGYAYLVLPDGSLIDGYFHQTDPAHCSVA